METETETETETEIETETETETETKKERETEAETEIDTTHIHTWRASTHLPSMSTSLLGGSLVSSRTSCPHHIFRRLPLRTQ